MNGEFESAPWWQRMNNGLPAGRVRGIEVRIHPVLILLWVYWILDAVVPVASSDAVRVQYSIFEAVMFIGIMFGSILAHELGHCYGAHLMGCRARRVLLWPLGGLASIEGATASAYNEFIVTIMGPLVSLALAVGATLVSWSLPTGLSSSALGYEIYLAVLQIRAANWMLFFFNVLIPLFPMDCARLLRSSLSMRFDPGRVTYDICLLGIFVSGLMGAVFFLFWGGYDIPILREMTSMIGGTDTIFLLIALLGLLSCLDQMKMLQYSEVYDSPYAGKAMFEAWMSAALSLVRFGPRPSARVVPIAQTRRGGMNRPRAASDTGSGSGRAQTATQTATEARPTTEVERLAMELEEAVKMEDFKRAAQLRDQINALKSASGR